MAVIVGVARETATGERRVALSPETCKKLVAAGCTAVSYTHLDVYKRQVIDEAHQLPELAAQFFGEGIGARPLVELARDAIGECKDVAGALALSLIHI